MACVKEEIDVAGRKALELLDKKRHQLQKEEAKIKDEIENSTKLFCIHEKLAEKKAQIDACKRFEEEFAPLPLQDDDEVSCAQECITRFLESQPSNADDCVTVSLTNNEHAPATNQEFTAQSPPLDPFTSAFIPDTVFVPPSVFVPPAISVSPAVSQNTVVLGTESHETNTVTDSPNPPPDNSSIVQAHLNAISKLLEIQNQNNNNNKYLP